MIDYSNLIRLQRASQAWLQPTVFDQRRRLWAHKLLVDAPNSKQRRDPMHRQWLAMDASDVTESSLFYHLLAGMLLAAAFFSSFLLLSKLQRASKKILSYEFFTSYFSSTINPSLISHFQRILKTEALQFQICFLTVSFTLMVSTPGAD